MPRVSSFMASHCRTAVWSLTMHARRTCELPLHAETLAVVCMSGTLGSRSHLGTGTKVPPCASRRPITWIPAAPPPPQRRFCPPLSPSAPIVTAVRSPRCARPASGHTLCAGSFRTGGARASPSQGGANSMNEHALRAAPAGADTADHETPRTESPAVRLLDAMRAGDDRAVVAEIAQSTTVAAENLPWACRGPDEVSTMLREMRERFPGLRFEPSTRHVGFGVVIEQARVRDRDALAEAALAAEVDDAARAAQEEAQGERHPMWDTPVRGRSTELVLWTESGPSDLPQPPVPLNLPVRVTV